ncbi:SufS family cysteine desulfurase [Candidatus Peribacteria bacterium]|nr:SufS family cysteine desulfurase [Candidatus Peribacteria bacterium]
MSLDISVIRRQFPFLKKLRDGKPVAYLDNAATTQKPENVLHRLQEFYAEQNSNINRGMHPLAEEATLAYEEARKKVASFIGAAHPSDIIFTRNATESINLVARSYGDTLRKGSGITLSVLEHHSNVIPWLQLNERKDIAIEWIELQEDGRLDLSSLSTILKKKKTKLIAVTGLSNVLGIRTPLQDMIALAHEAGAKVLIDAAQLIAHESIDVQTLDVDFLAFSGHKIYGPTGVGVLYGKQSLLESMPPFLGGGDMIESVDRDGFKSAELPRKFEAGTPSIADAIGLGAAIDWMQSIGIDAMHVHTKNLFSYARKKLSTTKKLTILGPQSDEGLLGCVSFTVDGIHPHDLTEILGRKGICLRAGHHCTQPLHKFLGITASTRLSVAVYNTEEEIDRCIEGIEAACRLFCKR